MRYLIILFFAMNASAQTTLEWSFLHPRKKNWIELGQKGSVQEALIKLGEMPDPFYGTNENQFGWIEEYEWEFKSIFQVDSKDLARDYVELEFPSVDTYAKIYLNDLLVLTTDNAFVPHRVQVKEWLKEGINEVHVVITPPVIYHAKTFKEMGYELPAPNDVHDTAIAPLCRKPQYQFGWDWALRMNTIGFNRPAQLYSYDNNRIVNSSFNVLEVQNDKAIVEAQVMLAIPTDDPLYFKSLVLGESKMNFKEGEGRVQLELPNPNLWWPLGQGEAHLYNDTWTITKGGDVGLIGQKDLRFGIKTSELIQEKDEWGTSYYFKINGRRIFCKGADYIPQEIFPARVTDESIQEMVKYMADANFNMVRVWGGGYYPDEAFFEACDEQGIMVWEDLMFACAMYPGDDKYIENIRKEFEYQVPRIAGHASVVQFNGNNEVEVAWGNWGFQIKYGLFGKSAREIEAAYDRIFKETAPMVIEKYTSVPYIHTSPLSNWGKMELYNHGSQHYWGVWHGKDPIEDFGKKIGRFNAEYGFQSFPEYSTLNTFSTKEDWELNSEVMKHHQKSYVGNNMIMKHAKRLFGEPEDFHEFIYYSQLTQSMAVSMAIAGHRIDAPRCGGTLVWQLNDCWPAPTWSSIDYEGNWKALHYQMQKDYKEVSIVAKYINLEEIDYYLVSNLVDTFECRVKCDVYELDGELVTSFPLTQTLNGQESRKFCLKGIEDRLKNGNAHMVFTMYDQNGEEHVFSFDRINEKYESVEEGDVSFDVDATSDTSGEITITNEKFVRNLWLYSDTQGVRFDRNFESLLPGTHVIKYWSTEKVDPNGFNTIYLD